MRALRGRADAGSDRGAASLVEMLLVMMVLGILLSACMILYTGAMRTTNGTQARLSDLTDSRIAVSAMGKSLRTAILPNQLPDSSSTDTAAFIEATPFSIRFFANINNDENAVGASKVSYAVTAGVLSESMQQPLPPVAGDTTVRYCAPGPGCVVRTKILARGVVVTGTALFRYYDQLGNPLTGTSLTMDQMEDVDSMDIQVTTKGSTGSRNGSTYVLRVALPNHDAVLRNGEES
ncbi:PulJ/GspJ family protein [Angustibacter sp. McL0619]|uniref:PulJ/GspJ family protein n=1 Tax=Angustibacter sp. McL0619 TaxID=3415676 RepID=UPI003CF1DF50